MRVSLKSVCKVPLTFLMCSSRNLQYHIGTIFTSKSLPIFKILFIFRQRGREGERGKHQCVVASCAPPTGDLAHNPGMSPDLGIEPATLWLAGWSSIH